MKTSRYIFVLLLLSVFLIGCFSSGRKVEKSELETIKEGVTTKQEIISKLGAPTSSGITTEGKEIIFYSYAKATPTLLNFIPVVNLVAQKTNVESEQVGIILDKNGVVEKIITNVSKGSVKGGILQ